MSRPFDTIARRVVVGGQLRAADVQAAVHAVARRIGGKDDRGSQVAEYAMLGGVSAAACTGLVAIFKNKETLRVLVDAVIGTLGRVIEGWF